MLRVPQKEDGAPDWPSAQIDATETKRRFDEARAIIKELEERDPGGDIELQRVRFTFHFSLVCLPPSSTALVFPANMYTLDIH